ncbi:MAG: heme biosynthesis protein HemY [Gammaproteobacteria bacterium]|nr:heme biosynthesis protein HemY [Gammaproteobacteria bacterium]MBU1624853.1 heme biosynthesis protein HemY [Gammaproteobacteria bacterium]MBU1982697.1 heme biosynthesis protein HemY [Gammaproteobacteria bacterium]
MRFLFWLLAIFAVAAGFSVLARNPGYVLLVYAPWRIELSLTMYIMAQLLVLAGAYMLLRLLLGAMILPDFVRRFRAARVQKKGREAMLAGLTAYFEGRFAAAAKEAERAIALGESTSINAIVAARAANELRQFDKRDAHLQTAKGKSPGDDTLRLMAQAQFDLEQRQPQKALGALRELPGNAKRKHIGALTLELKAQQQARNWDAVLEVANQLEKRDDTHRTMAEQMRQQAWLEKLRACAEDGKSLRAVWKSMPNEFKHQPRIAGEAARTFMRLGECAMSRKLLAETLSAEWDSGLVALYGDCREGSVVAQIEQAEDWLKEHHDDAGLMLTLGKLCLHQELWGKAQSYLDASISLQPSRDAYTTLAHLAEKQQKPDDAFKYYQKATQLAESGSLARK